jgi:hypothetical protein
MEAAHKHTLESLGCLSLTDEEPVQRALVDQFAALGMQLAVHTPRTPAEAQSLARRCSFTVAHLKTGVNELSSLLPVRSVQSPPLVVIADWKTTPAEREQLRLAGAAQVLEWPLADSGRAIRAFADANASFKVSQEFMVVTDVLQTMATRKRSGLVTVSCPHHIDFGVDEWTNGAACEGSDEPACAGWYGRLYLVEGALVHAETPTNAGVAALAQMIDLGHSTLRIQSVFVEPPQPNLSGPLENCILNAALLIDNKKRKPILKAVPPPPPPTRQTLPMPYTVKRSEKMKLETFTAVSPEVRAVVRADPGGEVLEAVGSVDAESLSAVVGMCAAPLERAAEVLGLSGLQSWSFTAEGSSLFVYRDDKGYTAIAGTAGKNPEVSFKKLGTLVKGRQP